MNVVKIDLDAMKARFFDEIMDICYTSEDDTNIAIEVCDRVRTVKEIEKSAIREGVQNGKESN